MKYLQKAHVSYSIFNSPISKECLSFKKEMEHQLDIKNPSFNSPISKECLSFKKEVEHQLDIEKYPIFNSLIFKEGFKF